MFLCVDLSLFFPYQISLEGTSVSVCVREGERERAKEIEGEIY